MTTELTIGNSFEERVQNRLRDSLGELMTDEELKKIIERSVEEIFFKPVIIKTGSYGHTTKDPSLVEKLLKEQLSPLVYKVVVQWVADHEAQVQDLIKEQLGAAFGVAVLNAFSSIFRSDFEQFGNNLSQRLANLGG